MALLLWHLIRDPPPLTFHHLKCMRNPFLSFSATGRSLHRHQMLLLFKLIRSFFVSYLRVLESLSLLYSASDFHLWIKLYLFIHFTCIILITGNHGACLKNSDLSAVFQTIQFFPKSSLYLYLASFLNRYISSEV